MPHLRQDDTSSSPPSDGISTPVNSSLHDFVIYNLTDAALSGPSNVAVATTGRDESSSRTAVIAGTSSAALVLLLLILTSLYLHCVRRRRQQRSVALLHRWLTRSGDSRSSCPSKGRPAISKPEFHANDTAILASKTRKEIDAEKAASRHQHLRSASSASATSTITSLSTGCAQLAKPEMVHVAPSGLPPALKPRPKLPLQKLQAEKFASGVSAAPTFISTVAHPGNADQFSRANSRIEPRKPTGIQAGPHAETGQGGPTKAGARAVVTSRAATDEDKALSTEEPDGTALRISLYPTTPSEPGKTFSSFLPPTLPTIDSRPVSFEVPLWQYDLFPVDAVAKAKAASQALQSVSWK